MKERKERYTAPTATVINMNYIGDMMQQFTYSNPDTADGGGRAKSYSASDDEEWSSNENSSLWENE